MTEFRDYFWKSKDGLKLHARDYGASSGKLPVVCVPGLTRNCRDFEGVAPWIADRGRRVLAVDLRGRGQSDWDPQSKRYTPATYAADIAALLDSIDAAKAVVIGTSLGGFVAMTLAYRFPARLGAAVINDVGPRVEKSGFDRIAGYVGKPVSISTWEDAAAYAKRTNGAAFPNLNEEDWMRFARRMFKADETGTPKLDYDPKIFRPVHPLAVWLTRPLVWSAFKRLARCGPLLLVRGASSDILDTGTLRRMRQLAPNMKVAEIPGVGHAPMLDEPESRAALADFFDHAQ